MNALTALVRLNDLGLVACKPLSGQQIAEVSRWRARDEELSLSVARAEAVRLAKRIGELDKELVENNKQITELVKVSDAAPLPEVKGFGAVKGATCLTVWSHQSRVHWEAAYASLAGVIPIPASSGNTVRHRLNRGGDKSLNRALHMVSIITDDPRRGNLQIRAETEG